MKKKWMLSAIGVLCLGLLAGCDKPVESTPVFSAPSSVPTSAPAVASHEPEQAHTPLPAPQLHELQSYAYAAPDDLLITLYVGNHATETEIPTKLPTREDGGTSTFACEEGILAIAAGTGAINIHISQDDGANWEEYNLEGADPAFAPRDIGFVTPQDGWLVLEEHITGDNKRNIIYTTGDAGASWQPVSPLDAEGYIFTAVFASPEVAWLTMYNESPSRVGPARFSTWETFDRGMTWQPVQALYTQDMLEGLAGTPDTSIDVTAPEWSEDA